MKRMLDSMNFRGSALQWDLPPPGLNRGYPPVNSLSTAGIHLVWCVPLYPPRSHSSGQRPDPAVRLDARSRTQSHRAPVRTLRHAAP